MNSSKRHHHGERAIEVRKSAFSSGARYECLADHNGLSGGPISNGCIPLRQRCGRWPDDASTEGVARRQYGMAQELGGWDDTSRWDRRAAACERRVGEVLRWYLDHGDGSKDDEEKEKE